MICPKCHGVGSVPVRPDRDSAGVRVGVAVPCDYPGCVDGIVHCCDGVQETPEPATDRGAPE